MTHANETLINDFYAAFARRDAAEMAAAYADDAEFSDPVFPRLDANETRGMWRMFCERGENLEISWRDVTADDEQGRALWEARYTFGATGRRVHNRIEATFELRDGVIVRHRDRFDFYRWSRMALGPMGMALGWTPIVRNQVRTQARRQLERFLADDTKR